MTDNHNNQNWYVYIVKCADGKLYTGITTDVKRRIKEHNSSQKNKGAKFTRSRQPVVIMHIESATSRSHASKREIEIKSLSRAEKINLFDH